MKSFRVLSVFLLLSFIVMPTVSIFGQTSVSIDHVKGLTDGKIAPNFPLEFYLRYTNNSGSKLCIGNGFRVYLSNNGELLLGTFEPLNIFIYQFDFNMAFDLIFATYQFSDGVGSDTVGMAGVIISSYAYPDGADSVVAYLTTSVSADFAGDSLCIDSSRAKVGVPWKWSLGAITSIPDWSGPYCYEILPSCCYGIKGNIDSSSDEIIDISDLDMFAGFMFRMDESPLCLEEIDWDGDGVIDISDLVNFIDFFFFQGSPPPACP